MAEIYAQVLENAGYKVDRTGIGLGDRPVVAPAIESGQIDLQPEYIGSRIGYELKNPPGGATPAASPAASGGITGPTGDSATNPEVYGTYTHSCARYSSSSTSCEWNRPWKRAPLRS